MAKRKRKVTIERSELKELLTDWVSHNMPGATLDAFELHRNGSIEMTTVIGDEQPALPGTEAE